MGGEAVGAEGLAEDGERAVAGEDEVMRRSRLAVPHIHCRSKGEGQAEGEPAPPPPAGQWCRHYVQVRKPRLEHMPYR